MKKKNRVEDMDSTQALLDSTLPDTPVLVDSVLQDSDEDEIFFGNKSSKETSAPFAKSSRRDTICLTDVDNSRRRSFNPAGRRKSREFLMSQPVIEGGRTSSSSLCSQENSITEEEEEDDVFGNHSMVQVLEVTSTIPDDDGEELEIASDFSTKPQSINITGRTSRRKRNPGQLVSLPSESTVREILEGNLEVERDARDNKCDNDAEERRSEEDLPRMESCQKSSVSSYAYEDSVHSVFSSFSEAALGPDKCKEVEEMEIPAQNLTVSDVSYANAADASSNSGVITFKTETSGSGVYDSFSDCTRDEFLQDTEVQEVTDISVVADETDAKFTNVKRRIFDGESGMESFMDEKESARESNTPFTLGRVSSEPSLGSSAGVFTLGSIDSELGDDEVDEPCVSADCGDDSVFSRKSLGENSILSLSFDVPDDYNENAEEEAVEEDENEMEVGSPTLIEPRNGVGNVIASVVPDILVTRAPLAGPGSITESIASPEFFPASPRLSYHTARNSSVTTDLSPNFDTTADEMMLYEMFGESYDEKVEAMSVAEKVALKEMLANRGDEEINMVAQKLHKIMQDKARESSIGSTVSPFSIPSSTPSCQISPDPSPPTPHQELAQEHVEASPYQSFASCLSDQPEFRVPPTVTYHLPTSASLGRIVSKSPSPCKISTPWIPPSPSLKYKVVVSPHKSRLPLSRLPIPVQTTPRQGCTPQQVSSTTPSSAKKCSRVNDIKAAAYAAVASPVAEYVKSNPAPPLVQNVRGKSPQRDLESTLVEVDDKENMKRLSQLPPCPLPPANYKAGCVSEEQVVYETGPEYSYIPEAYGTVNSSAKVTKHLARVKLGTAEPALKWNESCLVNDESLNSSPSIARHKAPAKSVLKQTRRDSGLFEESMMEVSVLETKVVKKLARGRGRVKNQ